MDEVNCVEVNGLATAADHSSRNIFSCIQSQLMQVQTHAGQHLEKSHLLLCDLIDQSRTGGIALRPLAVIYEMKWTALQSGFTVLIGLLKTSVPTLKRTRHGCALDLKLHPGAGRQRSLLR